MAPVSSFKIVAGRPTIFPKNRRSKPEKVRSLIGHEKARSIFFYLKPENITRTLLIARTISLKVVIDLLWQPWRALLLFAFIINIY